MEFAENKKPVIILSYNNCEIYCCHLDGYKRNTEALLNRLSEIDSYLSSKPINSKFRIWFNMDENYLNKSTMRLIAKSISNFKEHIYKISFIGLSLIAKLKFDDTLKNVIDFSSVPVAYFKDAESAKRWLV